GETEHRVAELRGGTGDPTLPEVPAELPVRPQQPRLPRHGGARSHPQTPEGRHAARVRGTVVAEGELSRVDRAEGGALEHHRGAEAAVARIDGEVTDLTADLDFAPPPDRPAEQRRDSHRLPALGIPQEPGPRRTEMAVTVDPLESPGVRQPGQGSLQYPQELLVLAVEIHRSDLQRHDVTVTRRSAAPRQSSSGV